jgi:hypothetical protein
MTETIESANAAASTLFLGHNGEWWDFWLIMSVALAAISAIAIGMTTTGSIVSHKREAAAAEQELERYKVSASEKIADSVAIGEAAKADAARADARAAEARLELEKFKAPRTLFAEQQARITEKVKAFSGIQFDGAWTNLDPEIDFLFTAIEKSLNDAGWKGIPYVGGGQIYGRAGYISVGQANAFGVLVNFDASKNPELMPAAAALVIALTEEKIGAGLQVGGGFVSANPNTIHILVGPKH